MCRLFSGGFVPKPQTRTRRVGFVIRSAAFTKKRFGMEENMMYDVAIIGAGVTGCAIARELSKYQARICVIECGEDVCSGTSKANSAIIHAGFDAAPGSLKAKLNVRGNAMMDALSEELDIPFLRNGSLVVCTKDQDRKELELLLEKGIKNHVPDLAIV